MVEPVFGRWGPTEVMERVLDGTWAEVVDGMGLIEPESISFSGTSAAITGLGSVEFTAVTSLSLNGVFSSDFDNYMIVVRHVGSGNDQLVMRLRLAGTDNSTANSYTRQSLTASSTTITGVRSASDNGRVGFVSSTLRSGDAIYLYGPALAQPTAVRATSVTGNNNAETIDRAWTHNASTAYDGCTLLTASPTFTGRVAVYGMVK
jgi:hypothetical protein